MMSRRGPCASRYRPVKGFSTPIMMAPGRMVRPEIVADWPWMSCTNSGTMIEGAMNAICARTTSAADTANVRFLKHDSFSSGLSMRNCRRTNTAISASPPKRGTKAKGPMPPCDSSVEAPAITATNPTRYKNVEGASSLPGLSGRRTTSGSKTVVSTMTAMAMAPKIQNIDRQPQASIRKPLMVGPMAGANPIIMPTMLVARPYWLFG